MNRLPDDIVNVIFNFTNYDNSLFTVNKFLRRLFKKWIKKNILSYACSAKKCTHPQNTSKLVMINNSSFLTCNTNIKTIKDLFIICKVSANSIAQCLRYFTNLRTLVICNQRITEIEWRHIKHLTPLYVEFVNCVFSGIPNNFRYIKTRMVIHYDFINITKYPFLENSCKAEMQILNHLRDTCNAEIIVCK